MPGRSLLREYAEVLLVAVLIAVFARTFVVQAFRIPTGSMEQNLLVGDHVLVNKMVLAPTLGPFERLLLPVRGVRRGDVIAFRFPDDPRRDFIKRCVALPGDRVEIIDKTLHVNGVAIDESSFVYHVDPQVYPPSQLLDESIRHRDNFGPYTVPPESYFVLGDNRDVSNDSRYWGSVPRALILGRPLLVYWSVEADDGSPDAAQSRQFDPVGAIVRMFTHTRWERSLRLVR